MRLDGQRNPVICEGDRRFDPTKISRRVLHFDSAFLDRLDDGAGATIEDRYFLSVHLDNGIVDLEREEGRHEMLNGLEFGAVLRAQHCAAAEIDAMPPVRL